jgi:peptidoglycan/xylan/chitin deacetylase (PgdA/CDA1 family)
VRPANEPGAPPAGAVAVVSAAWRLAARTMRDRGSVILCYHGVGASTLAEDPSHLRVPPARFRAQLELLLDAGFEFVSVSDFAERAGGGAPPPGLAALSFDDGMHDNHAVLLPILREYGLPATVYVVTGLIGKPNPWMAAGSRARMMTDDELRELAAAGVELGAHSVTHPDLAELDRERCLLEMSESRTTLERLIGKPVRTFAYPFCTYGEAAVAAACEAGFEAAVTCHGRGGWAPYELRRTMITGRDGMPSFVLKLAGRYEGVFGSTRLLRSGTRATRHRLRARTEHRPGGHPA